MGTRDLTTQDRQLHVISVSSQIAILRLGTARDQCSSDGSKAGPLDGGKETAWKRKQRDVRPAPEVLPSENSGQRSSRGHRYRDLSNVVLANMFFLVHGAVVLCRVTFSSLQNRRHNTSVRTVKM